MTYANSQVKPFSSLFFQSLIPWIVWGLGCLFYFYECLLQVSPSVMSNELMRDFSVTSHTLGILAGVYFYSYAVMQLPAGFLLDYFGPRRLLTIATLICALSTIAFGQTDNFYMACLARLMIGFGSAFAAVGTMKLAANWFPAQRFALLTGIMVTIGMMGAIGGETPLAILIEQYDWRNAMTIMGLFGLVLAVLIFLIAKDSPQDQTNENDATRNLAQSSNDRVFPRLIALLKNKQLWLIASFGGLMYMWTPVFCGLWGVPFLMTKLGMSKPAAANYISLVFVGWAIASPLWGLLSNRIGRRKPPMYIGSAGAFFTSLAIIYAPLSTGSLFEVLLFLFGVFSAGFLPAFTVAKEICSDRSVATGLSFMNMMNMIGIALVQPLIGYILDKLWMGEMAGSIRVYSLMTYYKALALMPIGLLISFLILPLIKETYCKSTTE